MEKENKETMKTNIIVRSDGNSLLKEYAEISKLCRDLGDRIRRLRYALGQSVEIEVISDEEKDCF